MHETGQKLSALSRCLTKFPQVLVNVPVRERPPLDSLAGLSDRVAAIEAELDGGGRILLRYSGTEPLARVMVEGEDRRRIDAIAAEVAGMIRQAIGS
jgi:phosphoglucosamine mutase